jgi:hypothetical protein
MGVDGRSSPKRRTDIKSTKQMQSSFRRFVLTKTAVDAIVERGALEARADRRQSRRILFRYRYGGTEGWI